MAKDCPKCGVVIPDEAERCDCGYNYTTGALRSGTNEVAREGGQTYKLGWLTAISCLTGAFNPDLFEANGVALGVVHACGFLVVGFAAAVVRPWSWHVLLTSPALLPVYGGYYMAFVAHDWMNRAMVAVIAVTSAVLQFAYFYKRRAMFGARWRWGRLERSYPRLVGPEIRDPVPIPGFAGLSYPRRLLFVAVVLAGIAIGLLSWVTPKPQPPNDRNDEKGWPVTFYTTGMEHSPTGATGTGWERTPWHAVQLRLCRR